MNDMMKDFMVVHQHTREGDTILTHFIQSTSTCMKFIKINSAFWQTFTNHASYIVLGCDNVCEMCDVSSSLT